MPLAKDCSYLEIPFNSETPNGDFHIFMSIREVRKKSMHQKHLYKCRTVGIISCIGQAFTLHEIDDRSIKVRVSLKYLKPQLQFTGLPFTLQLFGYAHWSAGIGPVLYPVNVTPVPPSLVTRLRAAMEWVVDTHYAFNPHAQASKKNKDA